jgi:hypothetical protein
MIRPSQCAAPRFFVGTGQVQRRIISWLQPGQRPDCAQVVIGLIIALKTPVREKGKSDTIASKLFTHSPYTDSRKTEPAKWRLLKMN